MNEFVWPEWLPVNWVRALLLPLIAWPLIHLGAKLLHRALKKHSTPQAAMLGYQIVNYGGGILLLLTVLTQLGFKISTILGAAGIAGVAIGFAAQTSLSNLISGMFLIWEKPFQVDDLIKVNTTMGVVVEIDLLSTKLRSFDNTLIRMPNETLIKSELVNITRYEIRRLDINLGVAYKEDVGKVIEVLRAVADANPYCLDEPEPLIMFKGFGASSLDFLFGVWFSKTDFLAIRNTVQREILEAFRREEIEIPFPHLTVYTGSATAPFPVRMVGDDNGPDTPPG